MTNVTGSVRLRLFKGQATVLSRKAPASLYDLDLASFGASEGYAHSDSSGFLKLFSLPQRAVAAQRLAAAAKPAEPAEPAADAAASGPASPNGGQPHAAGLVHAAGD